MLWQRHSTQLFRDNNCNCPLLAVNFPVQPDWIFQRTYLTADFVKVSEALPTVSLAFVNETMFLSYPILYHIRSGAFRAYYSIYASVRIYMRIHESHHQLPGFCHFGKKKKKLPMGLCEASFPLPASWGRHLAVISRSMECFPNVDSWSNIE